METIKSILTIIGAFIGAILLIYIGIGIGYLFGLLISVTPFVSDWLTNNLPIDKAQIPSIIAWLSVISLYLTSVKTVKGENDSI